MSAARGSVRLLSPEIDDINYRSIMTSDVDAVEELHKHSLPVRYSRKFFIALLRPEVHTIGAFTREGQLIGFVSGRAESVGWCGFREEGYIMTLAVDQAYRRRKLGSYLLQRMMAELRNRYDVSCVSLHVQASNDAAMRLYSSNGFVIVEHLTDYYEIEGTMHAAWKLVHRPPDYQPSTLSWFFSCC